MSAGFSALLSLVSGIGSIIALFWAASKFVWAIVGIIAAPFVIMLGGDPSGAFADMAVAGGLFLASITLCVLSIVTGAAAGVGFMGRARRSRRGDDHADEEAFVVDDERDWDYDEVDDPYGGLWEGLGDVADAA